MLFDGICRFCAASVRLVFAMDRRGAVRFTPIQSARGQQLAEIAGVAPDNPLTVVFFDNGRARFRSDGILAILARLEPPWRWLGTSRVIPESWGDAAYGLLARHRYRLFGRRRTCVAPDPRPAARFDTEPPA